MFSHHPPVFHSQRSRDGWRDGSMQTVLNRSQSNTVAVRAVLDRNAFGLPCSLPRAMADLSMDVHNMHRCNCMCLCVCADVALTLAVKCGAQCPRTQ